MKQVQHTEPPSLFRPPVFMVGRDRRGNWVVRDQNGIAGGLFVTRAAALRYVRSENGYQPRAVIMVSENLELDMSRAGDVPNRGTAIDLQCQRRIA
jgi:hypothetical protein